MTSVTKALTPQSNFADGVATAFAGWFALSNRRQQPVVRLALGVVADHLGKPTGIVPVPESRSLLCRPLAPVEPWAHSRWILNPKPGKPVRDQLKTAASLLFCKEFAAEVNCYDRCPGPKCAIAAVSCGHSSSNMSVAGDARSSRASRATAFTSGRPLSDRLRHWPQEAGGVADDAIYTIAVDARQVAIVLSNFSSGVGSPGTQRARR